jgi:hypothetical protein
MELKHKSDTIRTKPDPSCFVECGKRFVLTVEPVVDVTFVRCIQPTENVEQRTFARPRWTNQRNVLARLDAKRDTAQNNRIVGRAE